ncbi:hypothetical protein HDU87_006328 [Geranomyces variabilis]|uniref:Uncharacterized protein n=1 Tax=Geranomyces variabilis TaxID=109894 RepID=A0AAD5XP20_9FUNG|nr:hypothetical protein HDU87_006328 [Geranomyces variabilis]
MDFAYLDRLLAASKRFDKDLQELIKTVSLPPATPSPSARSNFLSRTEARISAVSRAAEDVENGALFYGTQGRATAAELVDAASDAVLQLERNVQAARVFLERYGYESQVPQVISEIAPAAEPEAVFDDDDEDEDDEVDEPVPRHLLFPPQRSRDSLPDVAPYVPVSPLGKMPASLSSPPRREPDHASPPPPRPLGAIPETRARSGAPLVEPPTPGLPGSPQLPPSYAVSMTPPRPSALTLNTGLADTANSAAPPRGGPASPPDSPLASLEDFGLSALSLHLLDVSNKHPRTEETGYKDSPAPIPPSYTSTTSTRPYSPHMPVASSLANTSGSSGGDDGSSGRRDNRSDSPTPMIPTTTTIPPRTSKTSESPPPDANSLFSGLLSPITRDDYARLSREIAAKLSLDYLNEMVNEVNEALTDSRFMGKGDDCISVHELSAAACIEPARAKAVISALASLGVVQQKSESSTESSNPKSRDVRYKVVSA